MENCFEKIPTFDTESNLQPKDFFKGKTLENTWKSFLIKLQFFSCNDGFSGILPTITFVISTAAMLYNERHENYMTDKKNAHENLQKLLLIAVFVFSVRLWVFGVKFLKWIIKQLLIRAHSCSNIQIYIKSLIELLQEQEDFIHLTLCWAIALIPANHMCDTRIYKYYFKQDQETPSTTVGHVRVLHSISATTFVLQICEVLVYSAFGNFGGILQAVLNIITKNAK